MFFGPSPALSLSRKSGCSLYNSLSLPFLEDVLALSSSRNHAGALEEHGLAEGGGRSEDENQVAFDEWVVFEAVIVVSDDEVEAAASPSPSRPLFHVPSLPPALTTFHAIRILLWPVDFSVVRIGCTRANIAEKSREILAIAP